MAFHYLPAMTATLKLYDVFATIGENDSFFHLRSPPSSHISQPEYGCGGHLGQPL